MVQRGRSLTSWLHRGRTGPAVFRATAVGQSRSGRCNSICRPIVPANPALAVRGPKHVVKTGTTPVLDNAEWRKLLDSIPTTTVRDLRDCALIATQTYSFARVTAAPKMKVEDLRPRGAGWTIRLHRFKVELQTHSQLFAELRQALNQTSFLYLWGKSIAIYGPRKWTFLDRDNPVPPADDVIVLRLDPHLEVLSVEFALPQPTVPGQLELFPARCLPRPSAVSDQEVEFENATVQMIRRRRSS